MDIPDSTIEYISNFVTSGVNACLTRPTIQTFLQLLQRCRIDPNFRDISDMDLEFAVRRAFYQDAPAHRTVTISILMYMFDKVAECLPPRVSIYDSVRPEIWRNTHNGCDANPAWMVNHTVITTARALCDLFEQEGSNFHTNYYVLADTVDKMIDKCWRSSELVFPTHDEMHTLAQAVENGLEMFSTALKEK